MSAKVARPRRTNGTSATMKSTTEYLTFNVPARVGFINITPDVEKIVQASGVQEELVLVNTMLGEEPKNA